MFNMFEIVGSEGSGKHDIGRQITDMGKFINLKVHTCSHLPVSEDSVVHRTGVQFVCFMMHQASKDSMSCLLDSIGQVDIAFFLGRSVIIANTKGSSTDEGVPQAQLTGVSSQYGIPVLFTNTQVEEERVDVCRKLLRMIESCVGRTSGVTPLMYEGIGLCLAAEESSQARQTPTPSVT